jgi:hypothetical protein
MKKRKTPKASKVDYLAPTPQKQLYKQAMKTINMTYKPELHDLDTQQTRVQAIAEKQRSDNQAYNAWLTTKSSQLDANATAADAALQQRQQEIATTAGDQLANIRGQLVGQAQAREGVTTNPAQAGAFDTEAHGAQGISQVQNERIRTSQMIDSNAKAANTASASNFAFAAANEANRQSRLWKAMADIGDARQKAILNRAADSQKEVARLLDREIQKAQIRSTIKGNKAKLAETTRHDMATEGETHRHNLSTEQVAGLRAQIAQQQADIAASKVAGTTAQTQAAYTQVIHNGTTLLGSKFPSGIGRQKAIAYLTQHGMDPLYATTAWELKKLGHLTPSTVKALNQSGYTQIPGQWTGGKKKKKGK